MMERNIFITCLIILLMFSIGFTFIFAAMGHTIIATWNIPKDLDRQVARQYYYKYSTSKDGPYETTSPFDYPATGTKIRDSFTVYPLILPGSPIYYQAVGSNSTGYRQDIGHIQVSEPNRTLILVVLIIKIILLFIIMISLFFILQRISMRFTSIILSCFGLALIIIFDLYCLFRNKDSFHNLRFLAYVLIAMELVCYILILILLIRSSLFENMISKIYNGNIALLSPANRKWLLEILLLQIHHKTIHWRNEDIVRRVFADLLTVPQGQQQPLPEYMTLLFTFLHRDLRTAMEYLFFDDIPFQFFTREQVQALRAICNSLGAECPLHVGARLDQRLAQFAQLAQNQRLRVMRQEATNTINILPSRRKQMQSNVLGHIAGYLGPPQQDIEALRRKEATTNAESLTRKILQRKEIPTRQQVDKIVDVNDISQQAFMALKRAVQKEKGLGVLKPLRPKLAMNYFVRLIRKLSLPQQEKRALSQQQKTALTTMIPMLIQTTDFKHASLRQEIKSIRDEQLKMALLKAIHQVPQESPITAASGGGGATASGGGGGASS